MKTAQINDSISQHNIQVVAYSTINGVHRCPIAIQLYREKFSRSELQQPVPSAHGFPRAAPDVALCVN